MMGLCLCVFLALASSVLACRVAWTPFSGLPSWLLACPCVCSQISGWQSSFRACRGDLHFFRVHEVSFWSVKCFSVLDLFSDWFSYRVPLTLPTEAMTLTTLVKVTPMETQGCAHKVPHKTWDAGAPLPSAALHSQPFGTARGTREQLPPREQRPGGQPQ